MTTDHNDAETCRIDYEPDHAVDVALDVALELADDDEVIEYIRRAQQSRVRARDEAERAAEQRAGDRNSPHETEDTPHPELREGDV